MDALGTFAAFTRGSSARTRGTMVFATGQRKNRQLVLSGFPIRYSGNRRVFLDDRFDALLEAVDARRRCGSSNPDISKCDRRS